MKAIARTGSRLTRRHPLSKRTQRSILDDLNQRAAGGDVEEMEALLRLAEDARKRRHNGSAADKIAVSPA